MDQALQDYFHNKFPKLFPTKGEIACKDEWKESLEKLCYGLQRVGDGMPEDQPIINAIKPFNGYFLVEASTKGNEASDDFIDQIENQAMLSLSASHVPYEKTAQDLLKDSLLISLGNF